MKSTILKKYLMEMIHFESESMNYFENPFSSDFKHVICDLEDENSWCSMDSSTCEKPMTILLDLESTSLGIYTGGVKGVYLFDININELKTYEGDHQIKEKSEYFAFEEVVFGLIEEVDSPVDEVSFGYTEGFKEKILDLISL
jgi:hypothetical protein